MRRTQDYERDTNPKSFLSTLFYFVVSLVVGSVILLGLIQILQEQNQIYELNSKNLNLQAEIKVLDDQIKETQVLISMHTSLEAVAERAKNEFGMIYPSGNQVLKLRPVAYYSLEHNPHNPHHFANVVTVAQKTRKEKNSDRDE